MVHGFNRTIEWRIVGRLATGSVPATALALVMLSWLDMRSGGAGHLITAVLSIMLLLTAGVLIVRNKISALYAHHLSGMDDRSIARLTIAMGALLGILVTFSSVGAGAIGVTALVVLYPRVSAVRIVGSDIAHAVPLTLIAGLGYAVMGTVDLYTLVSLLVGSFPGIFVGSSISARVPDVALRYVLAVVLIVVVGKLALDIPNQPRPNAGADNCTVALKGTYARDAVHHAPPFENHHRSGRPGQVNC